MILRSADDTSGDAGSAVVDYILVATLLIFVFLGVVQVALVLHARNVLVANAAEGARAAAVRGASVGDGEQACAELVRHALSQALETGPKPCEGSVLAASGGEPPLIEMHVRATLPLTFVPLGKIRLDVTARAIQEPR